MGRLRPLIGTPLQSLSDLGPNAELKPRNVPVSRNQRPASTNA
jgi:hypothetical protein